MGLWLLAHLVLAREVSQVPLPVLLLLLRPRLPPLMITISLGVAHWEASVWLHVVTDAGETQQVEQHKLVFAVLLLLLLLLLPPSLLLQHATCNWLGATRWARGTMRFVYVCVRRRVALVCGRYLHWDWQRALSASAGSLFIWSGERATYSRTLGPQQQASLSAAPLPPSPLRPLARAHRHRPPLVSAPSAQPPPPPDSDWRRTAAAAAARQTSSTQLTWLDGPAGADLTAPADDNLQRGASGRQFRFRRREPARRNPRAE